MKTVIALLVVLAVLLGAFFAFRAYQERQRAESLSDYQTVTVARGNLTATVGATGVVRANQTAQLLWKTNGTVESVHVDVGDQVKAGFPLITIEESSLPQNVILARADLITSQKALDDLLDSSLSRAEATQAVAAARAAVIEAERALVRFDENEYLDDLDSAREDVVNADDDLKTAREDFEPYEDWDEDNSTRKSFKENLDEAQRDFDEARRVLDQLELEKETAQSELDISRAQLEEAERALSRLDNGPDPDEVAILEAQIAAAEATLALANLEAPFDGTITEVSVKNGDQAIAGNVAFRIDDLSRLLVDLNISEVDINRVQASQLVSLSFDAIQGKEYRGTIIEVAGVGANVEGMVEFRVTVELDEPDEQVRPGMTAAVNVVVNQLDDVVLIPNRAVRSNDEQRIVYVLRNGALEQVPVTLGASSDTMSEVVSGELQVGDAIVLNPPVTFDTSGRPPFARR